MSMKLNAIGVNSKDLKESIKFYEILGFKFPTINETDDHVESIHNENEVKLMIDSFESVTSILGEEPRPSNHSSFALQYDTPTEVDSIAQKLKDSGYKIFKEPWDAYWGQRYSIVQDPSGYFVDLYASL